MFPTFISILDIQSWWEVPSIAHFCSLFRTAFNLLDFDIEDLEEALLTDGTEETSWLQELIVRLLSGCLPNNEISTFNYQMFLRRLFRQKCQEHDQYNPFNTDIDFQLLPLRTKVDILHALCDFRLDADDVLDQLKNLEADSLRVEPLGYDSNDSAYWYFYGTRLYREDFKTKNNKKKSVWQVICFTEEDWFQLNKKFKKSAAKCERQLHRTLSENFLPELPRLFREKERLARKRLLENQPRRTSRRLRKAEVEKEETNCDLPKQISLEEEEKQRKRELEIKRREAYERRNRLKEQSEDSQSEKSESRYEMGGAKARQKKSKGRQRKLSTSSSNSKDAVTAPKNSKRKKTSEESSKSSTSSTTTTVGRQTNNSLAAATGQIVIQPVANSHKKKLKTSQVFRQTDEDLITGMHKILDYVKNHEDAWPFADPVDEDYAPNYYTVIRKPMDLQRMEERLDAGYYKNFTKFRDDFQLIVDNCRLYNGAENEYTEMVDNLLKVFERATEKFLDQISSSDDEIAVEFPNSELDVKEAKKNSKADSQTKSSKRKPTLSAKTDKKREHSLSEESLGKRSVSYDSLEDTNDDEKLTSGKKEKTNKKPFKIAKKEKNETKKSVRDKINSKSNNKHKKERYSSPLRSRSPSRSVSRTSFVRSYSSSPPPSSAPSSPDNRFDFFPKKQTKSHDDKNLEKISATKGKQKQKQDKFKELFDQDDTNSCDMQSKKQTEKSSTVVSKPKDKHNKLRETIEKLKAKSEISNKLNDDEFRFDLDTPKENKEKCKKEKDDKSKNKKDKVNRAAHLKKDVDCEDSNSTMESLHSDNKKAKKPNSKSATIKNASIEALTIATEQTLKDINKWLDDTPKFSEFSSASNSPSYPALDDFDIVSKTDNDPRKKIEKFNSKKDGVGKDVKRRTFSRDPAKFIKRREVQRTIDRLQPGKSKGNLISSVQSCKQTDELFPLGPLSKNKDTKNSLIVKTNDNAPKLSLGSVLDSFGRHKFVDDNTKAEGSDGVKVKDNDKFPFPSSNVGSEVKEEVETKVKPESEKKESPVREESSMMSGATPNLSAWFKAFGAPKVQSSQKKSDSKADGKENEKSEDKPTADLKAKDENSAKVPVPDVSPSTDSPVTPHGQPIPRQRKISTGSSISERSSFSQDMDSPRVGIDERLGAYPAPYPSPLHRSPSGASPVMASPRPDVSPKAAPYPPFNGQIRVGFYQDTVSNKSSPDKSCSPRDNPQSPYTQCSDHVYTPNTTQNIAYSYPNSPYYSHTPNYSNPNPTPPYNPESVNPASYYDTNKSLTDQYQAKATQNYVVASSPANTVSSTSPHPQHSPSVETFRPEDQNQNKPSDKIQTAMFPVKKRAYNEAEAVQMSHRYETEMNRTLQPVENAQGVNEPMQVQNPRGEESMKHYIHQNIPDPKPLTVQTNVESYGKSHSSASPVQQQQLASPIINYSAPANPYNNNYGSESNYPLNIPAARGLPSAPGIDRKIDIGKYTNMGYGGAEVNFSRSMQQYNRPELTYVRPPSNDQQTACSNQQAQQPAEGPLHYSNSSPHMGYKGMDMNPVTSNPQQAHSNYTNTSTPNRLAQPLDVQSSYKSNEVSIPRPTYTHLDMDQPLGLRGNIANLSHIVDRYNNDERMLSGLQPAASQYYGDKGLGGPHMFNKPICTSSSGLPIFNQPNMGIQSYNQNIQAPPSSMYNRQITELQNSVMTNESKTTNVVQQGMEKKSKKRKSTKTAQAASAAEPPPPSNSQGFQSYAGLKSNSSPMEPSAISLKTASVVPGSAFNFGPSPTALGIGSGLYGDKDAYPNFLEDFRAAPNYYIAAATAAHHRSTPDAGDKQTRVAAHQSSTRQAPSYPFIGARQATPPSYPLGSHFMPSAQAPLMDTSSPLYQHYLQAGVLNQGLLGPPGPYPPGYHPALSMRQPYDSMTRPSWL